LPGQVLFIDISDNSDLVLRSCSAAVLQSNTGAAVLRCCR
jgi:hypothetical protein